MVLPLRRVASPVSRPRKSDVPLRAGRIAHVEALRLVLPGSRPSRAFLRVSLGRLGIKCVSGRALLPTRLLGWPFYVDGFLRRSRLLWPRRPGHESVAGGRDTGSLERPACVCHDVGTRVRRPRRRSPRTDGRARGWARCHDHGPSRARSVRVPARCERPGTWKLAWLQGLRERERRGLTPPFPTVEVRAPREAESLRLGYLRGRLRSGESDRLEGS